MKRIHEGKPRGGWETQVRSEGLVYLDSTDPDGNPVKYWREGPYYTLTSAEQELLEHASKTMFQMCIDAGDKMVKHPEIMQRMGIPDVAIPEIIRTWNLEGAHEPPSVYGRFDWRFGGDCEQAEKDPSLRIPKLLEFNADTPTSIFESGVTQWNWFEQADHVGKDQWNNLWEAMVEAWRRNIQLLERQRNRKIRKIHLAYTADEKSGEDLINTSFIAAAAKEAGYEVEVFYIEELKATVSHDNGSFYYLSPSGEYIDVLFKLYPWEWMPEEHLVEGHVTSPFLANETTWIEPIWKMLWSNKGLLPVLWKLFKDDPEKSKFLLPAYFGDKQRDGLTSYVKKPLLGREGANVTIYQDGQTVETTSGVYGEEGFVTQAFAPLPNFKSPYSGEDNYPLIGVWVIDGEPAGMGIRESSGLITNNTSYFAPHVLTA